LPFGRPLLSVGAGAGAGVLCGRVLLEPLGLQEPDLVICTPVAKISPPPQETVVMSPGLVKDVAGSFR
jgi:hypothetical protein